VEKLAAPAGGGEAVSTVALPDRLRRNGHLMPATEAFVRKFREMEEQCLTIGGNVGSFDLT
jgi:hypothetical protein